MKCPNCQHEIPANSKFCTFCGFQIPQVAATNAQFTNNDQSAHYEQPAGQTFNQNNQQSFNQTATQVASSLNKENAKNYWAYLVHGMKQPSNIDAPFNKYFGLVSLLVSSLLIALTAMMFTLHSGAAYVIHSYDTYTSSNNLGAAAFGVFFSIFLIAIVGSFFTYSITHLVTRGILGDKTADYMTDMTRYYHISSLGLIVGAVGFVFSILGAFAIPLATVCWFFYAMMVSMSFITLIYTAHATNNFDKVYAYLVGTIIMGVAGTILLALLSGLLGLSILSQLSQWW